MQKITYLAHTDSDDLVNGFVNGGGLDHLTGEVIVQYLDEEHRYFDIVRSQKIERKIVVIKTSAGEPTEVYVEPPSPSYLLLKGHTVYFKYEQLTVDHIAPTEIVVYQPNGTELRFDRKTGKKEGGDHHVLKFGEDGREEYQQQQRVHKAIARQIKVSSKIASLSAKQLEHIYLYMVDEGVIQDTSELDDHNITTSSQSGTSRVVWKDFEKGQTVYVLDAVESSRSIHKATINSPVRTPHHNDPRLYFKKGSISSVFIGNKDLFFDGRYTFMGRSSDYPYIELNDLLICTSLEEAIGIMERNLLTAIQDGGDTKNSPTSLQEMLDRLLVLKL